MILHTIIPYEQIFDQNATPQGVISLRPITGGFAQVQASADGERISRIISTDPAAYLNKNYQPGCLYAPPNPQKAP